MKTLFIALMSLALVSCSSTKDITDNPSPMTDFVTGRTYELKKPVYVWAGKLMSLKTKEPADSQGVLEAGTGITIRKVETFREPMTGNVTDVFGEVLSGKLKGKLVNVTWISKQDLKTGYTKRNPEMLEPVPGRSLPPGMTKDR